MEQRGLPEEFVRMLAEHQKLIRYVCHLYYSGEEDRKDKFQEIVLQLWRSYPSFSNQSKISTWIYQVAIHTIFSKLRKEKRFPKGEELTQYEMRIAENENSVMNEATEDLYRAIGHLSDLDKAVVLLYLEEHTYKEISLMIGISPSNVSTRINRIKTKLGKLLKPHYQ